MLANTGGDPLVSLARFDFVIFTSGDHPDGPHDGDLNDAAVRLAALSEIPLEQIDRLECSLIPLDGARGMTFRVGTAATLVSSGSSA
jgi:hypothetical protein